MKNMFVRGGGVVAGMLISEMGSQAIGKVLPFNINNKEDIIQALIGAGAIGFGMSQGEGLIGEAATFFGLGAVISAVLGFLKLKIPYLAQAGEEDMILIDEVTGQEIAFAGDEELYYDTETGEVVAMAGEPVELVQLPEDRIVEEPFSDNVVASVF